VQAIGKKGDENVRLDARLELVMDRADGEIAFEIFERLFHRDELQVIVPKLDGIVLGEIGAQQVSPFAPPHFLELGAIESNFVQPTSSALLGHKQTAVAQLQCSQLRHSSTFVAAAWLRRLLPWARP
jgi:hypothetical protein